jgi:hypothetical protein
LGLFRIVIGIVLLVDLAIRATDLRAMYTDGGMFSRAKINFHYTTIWNWSFHFAGGSWGYQAILFGVSAIVGIALLLGFRTRLATIGSWLMLISVQHRVPPILSGADILLRMLLFWGMFLPLDGAWSVDAWLKKRNNPAWRPSEALVVSGATIAILVQMAIMYVFSAMFKSNSEWFRGQAIAGSLAHAFYAKPLGAYLLQFPKLLTVMTIAVFALEWLGPLLLFAPVLTGRLRLMGITALAAMHVGIAVCLEVDFFSPVALAGLALFLPPEFWNSSWVSRLRRSASQVEQTKLAADYSPLKRRWPGYLTDAICLLLLLYIVGINLDGLPGQSPAGSGAPRGSFLRTACGLGQKWNMFDEAPSKSGWYVAQAKLRDGSEVDLLRPSVPIDWKKPPFPARMFPNHRWRKCFREMAYEDALGYQVFRQPVSEYLCRRWNTRNDFDRQVAQFDLIYCMEVGPRDAAPIPPLVQRERLFHSDSQRAARVYVPDRPQ